ncbi:hypothetical protein N0B51_00025 [Tsuneonella sp. YG55]|uniref:Uncharacterized protein n=1 Tax=Tsuneonella litorea TaxID=2976475 RepID=A0A9X2VY75_9SPHN|nr:hypothetical protein [Tsuneonella litorea]MCT2557362.1 hypothetical protein [Tsuneonella litorea]
MTHAKPEPLDIGELIFEVHSISQNHLFGDLFLPNGKPLMDDDWIGTAGAACHFSRWPLPREERGQRVAVYVRRASNKGDFYHVTCAREMPQELEAA